MIESSEILETLGLQGQIHYIDRYIEITLIQGHWNEIILKEESFINTRGTQISSSISVS